MSSNEPLEPMWRRIARSFAVATLALLEQPPATAAVDAPAIAPVAAAPDPGRSKEAHFDFMVDEIRNEDMLIVSRVGWLLTSQTFLVVAYVTRVQAFRHVTLLACVGLVLSILVYASILAALNVFVYWRDQLVAFLRANPAYPRRKLSDRWFGPGLLAPILVSIVVVTMWSHLLIVSLCESDCDLASTAPACVCPSYLAWFDDFHHLLWADAGFVAVFLFVALAFIAEGSRKAKVTLSA